MQLVQAQTFQHDQLQQQRHHYLDAPLYLFQIRIVLHCINLLLHYKNLVQVNQPNLISFYTLIQYLYRIQLYQIMFLFCQNQAYMTQDLDFSSYYLELKLQILNVLALYSLRNLVDYNWLDQAFHTLIWQLKIYGPAFPYQMKILYLIHYSSLPTLV